MKHFDELVTDRALHLEEIQAYATREQTNRRYLNRYWVTATSGSSGQPGFFLFNEVEWAHVLASFARGPAWSGTTIHLNHRTKAASIASSAPWHMSTRASATVKSWWVPTLHLAASEPLAHMVRQLNDWQPEILGGYAAMVGLLAEEQLAGRLQIHPQRVYTSSELLTLQTRSRVRDAWGNEPFNQYGATETAGIAAEHYACRKMHLFEDLVIVEVVDDHYQPVPSGEYGDKLLMTTLFSRTQPLIRYELNDRVRVSAQADICGLPFSILDIQGRVEDVLVLPAISGGRATVQPLVFKQVMDILSVSGWQVDQQADDGLSVLLAGASSRLTDETVQTQLVRSLAEVGVRVPYIQVQRVVAIPRAASGKALLIRAFHPNSTEASAH
jgi:phenylacetate-CoA ligase